MPDAESLTRRLFEIADSDPDRDALVSKHSKISYQQLALKVKTEALAMLSRGLNSTSTVGIRSADEQEHLILTLASLAIGATSCTIPTYESDEVCQRIQTQVGASEVLDRSCSEALLDQPSTKDLVIQDGSLLFSTSGTTGQPKLVMHQSSDIVAQAHRHLQSSNERFACLASIEHNFAKRHRLYCVAMGATNVFLEPDLSTLISQYDALDFNVLHLSAFQSTELLSVPDVSRLANVRPKLGGSHVTTALRRSLRSNISANLQAGYGTTETGAIGFTEPGDQIAEESESVGKPLPGIEVKVVSTTRQPLPVGERGELAIRCEGMFRGYLDNPEETNSRLEQNWFYTGDLGYLDDENRIFLCGRADDMFVFNSMNIYPQDIESQLREFPGVKDAAVLPRPSDLHGNIPVALIQFDDGVKPDLKKLKKHIKSQAGLRSPRQFSFVTSIPRNAAGKILRSEANDISNDSEHIRRVLVRALDEKVLENLKATDVEAFVQGEADLSLRKIGMDSLARMDLLVAIEVEFNVLISPQELIEMRSLGSVAAAVQAGMNLEPEEIQCAAPKDPTVQDAPRVVRLFRRLLKTCGTATAFNKGLQTLEHRLTPLEFGTLKDWNEDHQLIPQGTPLKFNTAANHWLAYLEPMIAASGKNHFEAFHCHRISPYVSLFKGTGDSKGKELLVCFSAQHLYHLAIPNAVLLQHTDANRFDVLIVAEPLGENYLTGVPHLGNNLSDVIQWICHLSILKSYKGLRVLGGSAGGFPAILAGLQLNANLIVSASGRFELLHDYPQKVIKRLPYLWRIARSSRGPKIILSYAEGEPQDARFAKLMNRMLETTTITKNVGHRSLGHSILPRLNATGQLGAHLQETIFRNLAAPDSVSKALASQTDITEGAL